MASALTQTEWRYCVTNPTLTWLDNLLFTPNSQSQPWHNPQFSVTRLCAEILKYCLNSILFLTALFIAIQKYQQLNWAWSEWELERSQSTFYVRLDNNNNILMWAGQSSDERSIVVSNGWCYNNSSDTRNNKHQGN